ncbi:hypothetical protein D3C71_1837230 [compost metagenome]
MAHIWWQEASFLLCQVHHDGSALKYCYWFAAIRGRVVNDGWNLPIRVDRPVARRVLSTASNVDWYNLIVDRQLLHQDVQFVPVGGWPAVQFDHEVSPTTDTRFSR